MPKLFGLGIVCLVFILSYHKSRATSKDPKCEQVYRNTLKAFGGAGSAIAESSAEVKRAMCYAKFAEYSPYGNLVFRNNKYSCAQRFQIYDEMLKRIAVAPVAKVDREAVKGTIGSCIALLENICGDRQHAKSMTRRKKITSLTPKTYDLTGKNSFSNNTKTYNLSGGKTQQSQTKHYDFSGSSYDNPQKIKNEPTLKRESLAYNTTVPPSPHVNQEPSNLEVTPKYTPEKPFVSVEENTYTQSKTTLRDTTIDKVSDTITKLAPKKTKGFVKPAAKLIAELAKNGKISQETVTNASSYIKEKVGAFIKKPIKTTVSATSSFAWNRIIDIPFVPLELGYSVAHYGIKTLNDNTMLGSSLTSQTIQLSLEGTIRDIQNIIEKSQNNFSGLINNLTNIAN
jgi:hypothetical protein